MTSLARYREYWERMATRVDSIDGALPITLDEQMGKKIQSLPADSVTLFVLPPLAESVAKNADSFREVNKCVVFLMEKYDPQRRSSFDVLEETQPAIERVKKLMLLDQSAGCPVMRIDAGSIDTAPETELYGRFAGWSIGFNIISC
ncbi:MAG: hypothetical protein NC102_00215 [Clostridium sp.]|nr:hypothetical protein [Clostridium sp.]